LFFYNILGFMFNINKFNEINDFLKKTSNSTKIVAVSKNHTIESINDAINNGVFIFGENRVQEALEKFTKIKEKHPYIELHLTGPLQSNKVKTALSLFDVFQTLDREKIAKEFSKYQDLLKNKKFFVQVNSGKEKTKSGIFPEDLKDFLIFLKTEMKLTINGLMCIPPIDEDPKYHFKKLKELAKTNGIEDISIGMSADYKIALQFNPKYIRLGTILFGNRK